MLLALPLQQIRILAPFARGYRWAVPVLAGLSLTASFSESVAISLVAVFLYSAIGPGADAADLGSGLLSVIAEAAGAVAGIDPISLAVLVAVFVAAKVVLSVGHGMISSIIKNVISERARNEIYSQYLNVSYEYIQERNRGDLVNILSKESWKLAEAFHCLTRMTANVGAMLVFGAMLVAISSEITLVAAAGALAVVGTLRFLSRPARRLGALVLDANNRLAKHMVSSLHGMRTIRAYAQEAFRQRMFEDVSREARKSLVKLDMIQAGITPIAELANLAVLACIVLLAATWEISFATTIAAVALLYRLQPHMREFERNRLYLAQLSAPLAAVESVVRRADKRYPVQGTRVYCGMREEIRFSEVCFAYPGTDARSLKKVDFSIRAGSTTAIVGPSGAGKTTIVNLLLRLYEPDSGGILLDGTPLTAFDRVSWLSRVAVAGQDAELIGDTILENIRLSRHEATLDEVREAAELAGISGFVAGLPEGYHSRVGEHGVKLSGGQRQRIGLARALLRDPDLLILDEATNAVDTRLEDQIRENIAHAMIRGTLVIITHRLESLLGVDEVITLECGAVIEQGPPKALLALKDGRWHHVSSRQVH